MGAIAELRPRMVLAHQLNVDITSALAILDEARQVLNEKDLNLALSKVEDAEASLEDSLKDHYVLAAELRRTRELFLTARRIGLSPGEASQLVTESRQLALAGEVEAARSLLAEAHGGLHGLLQEAGSRRALSSLYLLSQAVALGAEVEQVRDDLLASLEDLRQGDVNGTVAALDDMSASLRKLSEEAARQQVEEARHRLSLSPASLELSDLYPKLDEAEGLLASEQLLSAASLAHEVDNEAMRRQKAAVEASSARAARLLEISHHLGTGSATLDQKMALAGRPVDPGERIRILGEVVVYTTELVKDELTNSLARLSRDISAARKNGVSVAKVEKLSEDAFSQLGKGDIESSFALHNESVRELEKVAGLHAEVYDQIVLLSRMINEAKLPPDHVSHARLEETKRLFELGKYDGARVSGQECLRELESSASATLAPRRLKEVRDVATLAASLEIELPTVEQELERAEEMHRRGRNDETLALLHEVEKNCLRDRPERAAGAGRGHLHIAGQVRTDGLRRDESERDLGQGGRTAQGGPLPRRIPRGPLCPRGRAAGDGPCAIGAG